MSGVVGQETQAMLDMLKGGSGVGEGSIQPDESSGSRVEVGIEEGDAPEESPEFETEDSAEESQSDAQPSVEDESSEDVKPEGKAIEEIWVDDGKGRKKVKVDFSDKAKVKRAYEMAYGMRKFQRERDQLKAELEKVQPKAKEMSEAWEALEASYESDGIAGVINLLLEDDKAYETHIEEVIKRRRLREEASPDELQRLNALEEVERERREKERLLKQMKEREERDALREKETERKALESQIFPAFNKWSFSGKLGDSELEGQYDEALWRLGIEKLKKVSDDAELTPQFIDQAFREVASRFRKAVSLQADKKTSSSLQKKKDAASKKAAAMATSGKPKSEKVEAFEKSMKSGNLVDALRSVMTGQIKLK